MGAPDGRRIACFDLSGTLVTHTKPFRPLSMMPRLIDSLAEAGWKVIVVTTWPLGIALDKLEPFVRMSRHMSRHPGPTVISAGDKAEVVRNLLADDVEEIAFVDDKPCHFKAVRGIDDRRVHTFAFRGSGKYLKKGAAEAAKECGASFALSAIDLSVMLGVYVQTSDDGEFWRLSTEDLVDLIPGMVHIWDDGPGIAWRAFTTELWLEGWHRRPDMDTVWRNIAWIRDAETMWGYMTYAAASESGIGVPSLGKETWASGNIGPTPTPQQLPALRPYYERGLELMRQSVDEIGRAALTARPPGHGFPEGRVEHCLDELRKRYGRSFRGR